MIPGKHKCQGGRGQPYDQLSKLEDRAKYELTRIDENGLFIDSVDQLMAFSILMAL